MNVSSDIYHVPALLEESIQLLDIKPDGIYIDATFGGGGHSREILKHLGSNGRLLGFDRDIDARANVPDDPRFIFVHSDFRYMPNFMRYYGLDKADGILADLGVSFHHFDTPERGFSLRTDGPLDMRMNTSAQTTAKDLLEGLTEKEIKALLDAHTDLKNTGAIARRISAEKAASPIDTTFRLVEVATPVLDPRHLKKDMAQLFQALRIATNDETGALRSLLENSPKVLKRGGRMAVLTYHSGEDRMVKDFFKKGSLETEETHDAIYGKPLSPWKLITRNPVTASEEEVERNPRARSAKLRVAQLK